MSEELTRPIIGIENRTAQEVFDIMADRIRSRERLTTPQAGEVERAHSVLAARGWFPSAGSVPFTIAAEEIATALSVAPNAGLVEALEQANYALSVIGEELDADTPMGRYLRRELEKTRAALDTVRGG